MGIDAPSLRRALRAVVLSAAAAGFVLLAGLVIFAASTSRFAAPAAADGIDGVVVLTGGEHRVREGLRLFEQTKARRILISGVNRQTTRDDLRRQTSLPRTLFSCCVDVGYRALDTAGNAEETAFWADAWRLQRIAVVTSSYHMPRGLLELGRALPRADLVPHAVVPTSYGSGPWWTNALAVRILTIEYVKAIPAAARFALARLTRQGTDAGSVAADAPTGPVAFGAASGKR